MMKRIDLKHPPINEKFLHGEIIDWKFRENITLAHGKYTIRFTIWFADGTSMSKERGGFTTKQDALQARNEIVSQLEIREFVAIDATVAEFYEYWLWKRVDQGITYHTFNTYRNGINKYILPVIGKLKLTKVEKTDLLRVMNSVSSESILKTLYGILGPSFREAKNMSLVHRNYARQAIRDKRKMETKKKKKQKVLESLSGKPTKTTRKSLNGNELCNLLYLAKMEFPDFYIPLLVTISTGCRISELIAIQFKNIDFKDQSIHIETQLGRPILTEHLDFGVGELGKQHLKPKSKSGFRRIPIPDFVLNELVLAKERYADKIKGLGLQVEEGYIWHQPNFLPHGRQDYAKPFKALKHKLNIPNEYNWHKLRHSYATLLSENMINPKELAVLLGHVGDGDFSMRVYVDTPETVIYEGIPAYFQMITEILPVRLENGVYCEKEVAKINELPTYISYLDALAQSCSEVPSKPLQIINKYCQQ